MSARRDRTDDDPLPEGVADDARSQLHAKTATIDGVWSCGMEDRARVRFAGQHQPDVDAAPRCIGQGVEELRVRPGYGCVFTIELPRRAAA